MPHTPPGGWQNEAGGVALGAVALAGSTWLLDASPRLANPTSAAMVYLLIVLAAAALSTLRVAIGVAVVADGCLNFFFMAPVRTFAIAEPQNWVALFVFLAVSVVGGHLSATARARASEATARRDELGRLFDLSRDVLLTTGADAIPQLATYIARRFELDYAAICLPGDGGAWRVFEAGGRPGALDEADLSRVLEMSGAAPSLQGTDPAERHPTVMAGGRAVRLVALRAGGRPVGLLAAAGRAIEEGTLDALAGVGAIAVERAQFLEDLRVAEVARQSEELKSALIASMSHGLRTPLTAIRIAASNLQASWPTDTERREQGDLVLAEVARLTRLFDNILEMARIDAGPAAGDPRWVHPAEIFEAARDQVEYALNGHVIELVAPSEQSIWIDPRPSASALAHLLENAAQYSPPGSRIVTRMSVSDEALSVAVCDEGPGVPQEELPRLFERFYRGGASRDRPGGTGMGLSIVRGILGTQGGRVWAENGADGGAVFSMTIPAAPLPAAPPPAAPAGAPGGEA